MAIDVNSLNLRYNASDLSRASASVVANARTLRDRRDIANNNSGEQPRSQGFLRQQSEFEDRALARLSPVRATLSPSDEVSLFANAVEAPPLDGRVSVVAGEATDATGEQVSVEIITSPVIASVATNEAKILPLAARQQSAVSSLYARNNDVVFNSSTILALAA